MKLRIFDKIFLTVKRAVAKEQGVIDRSMQKEIKTYVNKSKKLLKIAEIIEIEHDAGKYSVKSIDGLKQQRSAVQSAERELQHSRKELSQVPASLEKLEQEQSSLKREVNALNQENRKLFLQAMQGEITYQKAKDQREINYNEIKDKNSKINKNDIEIKNFEEKIQKLHENIQNNLNNFKNEVATLESEIQSIENVQAPKPPIQPPRRPAPDSPIEVRDNLKVLAGYFNDHGAYDEGKQYLLKGLDIINDFGIIDDENLQNMQNSINKSTITGQELIEIINTATASVDHDLKLRMEKPVISDYAQKFADRFEDRFVNKVENIQGNKQEAQTFADKVKGRGRMKEGNNQETQTFAGKVKERTQEENETYRL